MVFGNKPLLNTLLDKIISAVTSMGSQIIVCEFHMIRTNSSDSCTKPTKTFV